MKQLFAVILALIIVVGCERGGPTDSASSQTSVAAQSTGTFGEVSMYKMTVTSAADIAPAEIEIQAHDSLKNNAMLDSLKIYLALTDEQVTLLKTAGTTLFTTLEDIRAQVQAKGVTPDSALVLVRTARDQFVASVKAILTADQLVKFEEWLTLYWNKTPKAPHRPRGGGFHPDSLRIKLDSLKICPDSLRIRLDSLKRPVMPDSLRKPFVPDTTKRPGGPHKPGMPGMPGGPKHP
jgi:hypothetical protein